MKNVELTTYRDFFGEDFERFISAAQNYYYEYADWGDGRERAAYHAIADMLLEDGNSIYEEYWEERGQKFTGDLSQWAAETASEIIEDLKKPAGKGPRAKYPAYLAELYQYRVVDHAHEEEERGL